MKASDIFVQALENEGVEYIFAVPGEENLDLVESIRKSSIHLIVNRHEQAAGFMAATYGRLTGKTGVCLATLGPGATNLVTAAAYAQLGGMPLMMITGQKPIKRSKQGKFQIIDVIDMFKPVTKSTKQIVNADTIPALIRESFRLSQQERLGAVHLELPEDIAGEETQAQVFPLTQSPIAIADEASIHEAAMMIQKAKKPLLLIGAGANRKQCSQALREFLNKTQIPFFNTQMGKGVVDERDKLFMGTAALSANDYLHCAIDYADLIINIGHDVIEKPPFIMERNRAKVIHVNFFPALIDEVYFPQLEVIGDVAHNVSRLSRAITKTNHWDFAYFYKVKAAVEENILEGADDERFPVLPPRVVADVRAVLPEEGIIALDNGMYKLWFSRNYKAHHSNTVLLDNALATMGAGLPSAMAAKLVYPDRPIIGICGDGGLLMSLGELETAVRLNLNLVILVLRDNGYGMIKWKQEAMGFQSYGLDFSNPDFVLLANSFGAQGHRVTKTKELKQLLQDCLKKPGVHLIDLPVDYSENVKALDKNLKEKTCLVGLK